MSTNPIIDTQHLTCRYGRTLAVDSLNLSVTPGSAYAFLGPNGAGKTTTIKALMGLIRPKSGSATIFETPSDKLGRSEFERIGYVSENQTQPNWMTVRQFMNYCRPLYPTWDDDFCRQLLSQFNLPLDRKLKQLSRGMKMKAALISSIAYRPELLVLDEPFGGLDPLVREEFIEGMLEITEQESWTIFISSHDIDEVERLADTVGILNDGRLVLSESVDSLQRRFRKVDVGTAGDAALPNSLPSSWLLPKTAGQRVELVHSSFENARAEAELRENLVGVESLETHRMTLKEIYLTLARDFAANTAEALKHAA